MAREEDGSHGSQTTAARSQELGDGVGKSRMRGAFYGNAHDNDE